MEELQLNSEREARIASRRKRVQEKLAALRQGDTPGKSKEDDPKEEASKATQQILESKRRLLRLKHRTDQEVTAVRTAADQQESQHRANEERQRQELRSRLLAEAEQSASANAAVAARWPALFHTDVPQELFAALEEQRAACEAIIGSKDALIADIQGRLKAKDDEYVKLLKRQAEDIDSLLARMGGQAEDMGAAYREELEAIERALLQERSELLDANRKEIAELLDKRSKAESDFLDRYQAAVEGYQKSLDELRINDGEDYHVLKVKLESDIATLEQHLETMRSTYQLNSEKLEYNYRVLVERDGENGATINTQKRKLSRQHDVLASLKAKYAAGEARCAEENSRLTDEYRRITEQFKDLQAKFRHFDRIDAAKFAELWALQQEEATALTKQLLQADRVIHEQQLGWSWVPPDDSIFTSPHDLMPVATTTAAAGAAAGTSSGDASHGSNGGSNSSNSSSGADKVIGRPSEVAGRADEADGQGEPSSGGAAGAAESSDAGTAASAKQHTDELQSRVRQPRYFGALCLLVDEAGFLLEPKTRAMLERLPQDERGCMSALSVLRALGVTDGPGFEALMEALALNGDGYGTPNSAHAVTDAASTSDGGASAAPVLVHPDDVITRLRAFLEAECAPPGTCPPSRATTAATGATRGAAVVAVGGSCGVTGVTAASRSGATRRAAEKEREYWVGLTNAVSDKEWRVWNALEGQLEKYHALLVGRAEGLRSVESLQQQNDELRQLLNTYLASNINSQLKVPPTSVM